MSKKYIFLYNVHNDVYVDLDIVKNKLSRASVDFVIKENYGISNLHEEGEIVRDRDSIWIREDHYVIAMTIIEYDELLRADIDSDYKDYGADDIYQWYENHKNKEYYVLYKFECD